MKNNTMSSTTLVTGVLFAFPQDLWFPHGSAFAQDAVRRPSTGARGAISAPTHKTTAVKDVAYLRSWVPLV